MDDNHSKIQSIVDICGCNEGTAIRLLQSANFDLNSAIDKFFTNGGADIGPSNAVGSSSSARNGGASSSAGASFPAPPALKKPLSIQPAEQVDLGAWNVPYSSSQSSTQPASSPSAQRQPDGRQVKFDEASLGAGGGGGGGNGASSSNITSRPGPWTPLVGPNPQSNQENIVSPWTLTRPEAMYPLQPRDSEGRVKRARPDAPGDQSDHPSGSSPSQTNTAKRSTALRFSEQGQSQDQQQPFEHMQLDTPPPEPETNNNNNSLANAALYDPNLDAAAEGWNADLDASGDAILPYGPDNFASRGRPPSPPPRREAGTGVDANQLSMQLSSSKEDYELELALQASLQDQGVSSYQGGNGGGGAVIEEDDPELAAAIQASMTDAGMIDSWFSAGSAGFGSKSSGKSGQREAGKVPDHLIALKKKEALNAPPALAAPFESLRLFPLIFHAIYALPPIRRGFQSYEMDRLSSINDMSFFWTGVPAGKKSNAAGLGKWISNEEREKADIVQRLQVLFFFMDRTQRPFCMTGSVLETLPQSVMTLNSGQPDPADVAMYTVGSLFDSYRIAIRAVAGRHSEDQENWVSAMTRIFDTLVSYGVPAPPWPVDAPEDNAEGGPSSSSTAEPTTSTTTTAEPEALVMPTLQTNPLTTFNSTHLELRHTKIVNDMTSAVLTVLEDDAALVTIPGETLCVGVKRETPRDGSVGSVGSGNGKGKEKEGGGSGFRPWRIDKHFYADPFLWERRRGVAHGQAPGEAKRMEDLKRRRDDLTQKTQRRKWLGAPAGKDAITLMNDSIAYLEGPGLESGDAIRTQTNEEAAVKLKQIREHLQNELNALDKAIAADEDMIAKGHAERIDTFRKMYEGKPEWQTVRYDLRAVLIKSGDAAWAYVQHRGHWFRVQDGHIHATDETTALGDESGASEPNGGVFFLAYVRSDAIQGVDLKNGEYEERKGKGLISDAEAEMMGELLEHGVEGPLAAPEPFAEAIETDNEEFQAMLLSMPTGSPTTETFPATTGSSSMLPRSALAAISAGFQKDTTINLSGLLQEEHEQRGGDGSPSSSVVVEIDFRDEP
ncbi:hypothetical protein CF327_g2846 [Tilletia walkeri]|nr:hypothetical protein CF327_g2846 [Tilletia walkeri]